MKIDRIEVYGYDLSYRYGKYVMSGNQVINSIPSGGSYSDGFRH